MVTKRERKQYESTRNGETKQYDYSYGKALFFISHTDLGLLKHIKKLINSKRNVKLYESTSSRGHILYVHGIEDIYTLLLEIEPYLKVRKREIEEVIAFCESRIKKTL